MNILTSAVVQWVCIENPYDKEVETCFGVGGTSIVEAPSTIKNAKCEPVQDTIPVSGTRDKVVGTVSIWAIRRAGRWIGSRSH